MAQLSGSTEIDTTLGEYYSRWSLEQYAWVIAIYSLQGEQLRAEIRPGSTGYEMDVSPFTPGIYILKFRYQGLLVSRKLMISP